MCTGTCVRVRVRGCIYQLRFVMADDGADAFECNRNTTHGNYISELLLRNGRNVRECMCIR